MLPIDRRHIAKELKEGKSAGLLPRESAILHYAEKLTREPATMSEDDVGALRQAGLTDREVHDVAHVAAYFAYVNRMVLGLGAEVGAGEGPVGQWPGSDPTSDPTPRSL